MFESVHHQHLDEQYEHKVQSEVKSVEYFMQRLGRGIVRFCYHLCCGKFSALFNLKRELEGMNKQQFSSIK